MLEVVECGTQEGRGCCSCLLPGPASSKAMSVFPVGTHTNNLPGHIHTAGCAGQHGNTALTLSTNSTNGLLLFAALTDQDEGLLGGCIVSMAVHMVWIPPAAGLRHSVYQELSRVSQVSLLHYRSSLGLRHSLPSDSCWNLEPFSNLSYSCTLSNAHVLKYVLWITW